MRQKNYFDVNKLIQACETLTQSFEIFRGNPTTYSANRVERQKFGILPFGEGGKENLDLWNFNVARLQFRDKIFIVFFFQQLLEKY